MFSMRLGLNVPSVSLSRIVSVPEVEQARVGVTLLVPSPPIAEQLERRPVEGVGRPGLLPDLVDLRRPQGFILGLAALEIAVETLHEASGGIIGDTPQR